MPTVKACGGSLAAGWAVTTEAVAAFRRAGRQAATVVDRAQFVGTQFAGQLTSLAWRTPVTADSVWRGHVPLLSTCDSFVNSNWCGRRNRIVIIVVVNSWRVTELTDADVHCSPAHLFPGFPLILFFCVIINVYVTTLSGVNYARVHNSRDRIVTYMFRECDKRSFFDCCNVRSFNAISWSLLTTLEWGWCQLTPDAVLRIGRQK